MKWAFSIVPVAALGMVAASAVLVGTSTTLGYWRFEEGTGDVIASGAGSILDSSGSGDNGTPVGTPVYRSDVPVSPIPQTSAANTLSLEFNSSDDKVVYSSTFPFNLPGDLTLEFWLKYPGTSHDAVLWGIDTSGAGRFHIYVNPDDTLGMDYVGSDSSFHPVIGGGNPCCGVAVPTNAWAHVAITRTGNTYRSYVNGVLSSLQVDVGPVLPTAVGWSLSGRAGFPFNGSLDEVRISSGALVPGEFLRDGPPVLSISIDIKPGSFPNSINPRSNGVIPVAILTTSIFDATTVAPSTVRFGPGGTEATQVHSALEDVDGDSDLDMILQFRTQDTGIVCGATSASLTGQTFAGQAIEGSDSIMTVGCK